MHACIRHFVAAGYSLCVILWYISNIIRFTCKAQIDHLYLENVQPTPSREIMYDSYHPSLIFVLLYLSPIAVLKHRKQSTYYTLGGSNDKNNKIAVS